MLLLGSLAVGAALAGPQQLDLSSVDKLAAKAKSYDQVNIDGDQLKAMKDFVPEDQVPKEVTDKLRNVQIRSLEFGSKGKYSDADVEPVRKQIIALGCSKMIDSKEDDEHSEIYSCNADKNHQGIAIISAEPTELSIVFVAGIGRLSDLSHMHGMMGLPKVPKPPTRPAAVPDPPAPPEKPR